MAEVFKFQKNDKAFFNVDIDGTVVSFPIGASMPVGLYDKLAQVTKLSQIVRGDGDNLEKLEANTKIFHELTELFSLVIDEKTFKKLKFEEWAVNDLVSLFNAWQTAALKFQGVSLGESQASASS